MKCLCFQRGGKPLLSCDSVHILKSCSKFYTTLKERVEKYFKENNIVSFSWAWVEFEVFFSMF